MSQDRGEDENCPEGRHQHEPHGHGRRGHGRRSLHSARKLSSSELQQLLLLLLSKQPSHGYELIKYLEERTDGFYVPSPGMIYPALTYLEEVGLASVQAEGAKKLYQLTDEGQAHLQENREAAEGILAELERVGAQMANARKAFAEGADDGEGSEELEAARRALKRAQREREPFSPDEAERIAEILQRAASDIAGDAPSQREARLADSPIYDAATRRVLSRLLAAKPRPPRRKLNAGEGKKLDPYEMKNFGFNIRPEQGEFVYLLCRSMQARRVAEFATSLGFSAIHLAAAVRDNGGGLVIGSEIVPEKVKAARRNLADAGLDSLVEIREGDALESLRDLGGPIDFFLMDGWPVEAGPSLARQVLEIVAPQIRVGGVVLNDNGEPDYLEYVRDPARGFLSMRIPFQRTFELSVKMKEN